MLKDNLPSDATALAGTASEKAIAADRSEYVPPSLERDRSHTATVNPTRLRAFYTDVWARGGHIGC